LDCLCVWISSALSNNNTQVIINSQNNYNWNDKFLPTNSLDSFSFLIQVYIKDQSRIFSSLLSLALFWKVLKTLKLTTQNITLLNKAVTWELFPWYVDEDAFQANKKWNTSLHKSNTWIETLNEFPQRLLNLHVSRNSDIEVMA